MEDELLKKKLAYPYGKFQTTQPFYKPLKLGEDFFYFKTIISRL